MEEAEKEEKEEKEAAFEVEEALGSVEVGWSGKVDEVVAEKQGKKKQIKAVATAAAEEIGAAAAAAVAAAATGNVARKNRLKNSRVERKRNESGLEEGKTNRKAGGMWELEDRQWRDTPETEQVG